ncbi:unnamed protein product [Cuscuta europaea]|uniref:non-specific serine/threonine protein kinase n=1 Tax=Cuscuta europaea TaxID=41803 RepID=A0A9P0ZIQ0_CUSEU|nr:unnamed protein product [Cuscuta europaea]
MASKSILVFFMIITIFILGIKGQSSKSSQGWIRAGYWESLGPLPVHEINSPLFTHLFYGFAFVNPTTFQLFFNSSNKQSFIDFTATVKRRNPSIITILSVWFARNEAKDFWSMVKDTSHRKSFIESSLKTARLYGFHGLDLFGVMPPPENGSSAADMASFLDEWRAEVVSEGAGKEQLLLTMLAHHKPAVNESSGSYPVDSMKRSLDWISIQAFDYYVPTVDRLTGFHAALYSPDHKGSRPNSSSRMANTDDGLRAWLSVGYSPGKMVLGLPYHGYIWTLDSNDSDIGSPAWGLSSTADSDMGYKSIVSFIQNYGYGAKPVYNSSYVANSFTLGDTWINYDDVDAVQTKVSYAKSKGLLGYNAFQIANDYNWALSQAAADMSDTKRQRKKKGKLWVIAPVILAALILIWTIFCYVQREIFISKGHLGKVRSWITRTKISHVGGLNSSSSPNLQVFRFSSIKAATKNFASENMIGHGGYGPVYKGKLRKGEEIAVKRLSKSSSQGIEEFENEVTLTASLQHVNLLRVIGICTEREEKMLIYEFMPNKSLDFYLYTDQAKEDLLDWRKRVSIIEGLVQGLLYLHEYSNFTIIHRDIKASNILLDEDMNPKISDFGMAKSFKKDGLEAYTARIVGTYGYVPPEYVKKGTYSLKYDVYSFGVVLLQIISGKRTSGFYGCNELNLLEYAYELWKQGEATEFFDASLDDSCTECKMFRCMQVGLLCVQEDAGDRPSMVEVFALLKNENGVAISTIPKKPAFSVTSRDERSLDDDNGSNEKIFSVNLTTITQLVPR